MQYQVSRNSQVVETLNLTLNAVYTHELMGAHNIIFSNLLLPGTLDIQIGDTITYKGELFTINTVPDFTKHSNISHEYNIVFEGIRYQLYDKLFMFENEMAFPFFGTAREYLQLLIDNINEIHPGWTLGNIDDTEPQSSEWDSVSCRVALTKIAELFGLEWYLTGTTIHMVKVVGNTTSIKLAYGKGKGLYSLTRQYVEDKNVITRVYGKGGTRNLPSNYGGRTLSIPERYLEANVDKYGIREGVYTNEEIFPKREGTITSFSPWEQDKKSFSVTDTSIDFDVNSYLLEGLTAKIVFTSGELNGNEFEISKYDHSTKTITFNANIDDQDYILPNESLMPAIGDKYFFYDINMPEQYVSAAIEKLRSETILYRDQNKDPQVLYSFTIDVLDMKRKGWWIEAGDRITLEDSGAGINGEVRINSVSYPIQFPEILEQGSQFNANVANFIPYTVQERVIKDTIENQTIIKVVDKRNAERARRNAMNLRQLRDIIFDPDDYFDNTNLRPNSIETLYLSVGAKSQNFGLNGVSISPNTGANPNVLTISSGSLIHYEVSIDGLGYVWEMVDGAFANLVSQTVYYLSAKCSRFALTGTWYLSQTPMKAESEVGYYHFNVGVLYAVKDGYRGFDFTKGMTYIVGDTITTGTIKSLDGLTFLGLNDGSLKLGDLLKFNTVENRGELEITGKINVLPGGNAATKDDVNGIAIGGRNYVLATQGSRSLTFNGGNNEVKYLYALKAGFYGKEITLHFDYTINNTAPFTANSRFIVQVQKTTVSGYLHGLTPNITITDANKSGHYKRTVTLSLPSGVAITDTVYIHVATYSITGSITFSNFKLELGNKETDWSSAPEDINQSIEEARQQAENAKQTADIVAGKTNFLQTSIDGNVIATGTLLVGDAVGNQNAGITGVVDDADNSVRVWAGDSYANKKIAPFRLQNNGYVYARNLTLGYGQGTEGWKVSPSGIISDPVGTNPNFALIRGSDPKSSFAFATDLIPASSGSVFSLTGRLVNKKLDPSEFPSIKNKNTALELEASGADENVAIEVKSGVVRLNGNQIEPTQGTSGMNVTLDFRTGGERWNRIQFINGIAVSFQEV